LNREWESQIQLVATRHAPDQLLDVPVKLELDFRFDRPKKPRWSVPAARPDWDKLARFVCDALEGVIYVNDGRVVVGRVTKSYGQPGCRIRITELNEQEEMF
jgi:Holliday junction resolvase RusA-like endonuclease